MTAKHLCATPSSIAFITPVRSSRAGNLLSPASEPLVSMGKTSELDSELGNV